MTVLQVKGRITQSQKEFDELSFSSNSLLYLRDANTENIDSYSLDLTLGDGWNDSYSPANRGLIHIESEITIPRLGSIVVQVKEELRIPHNRYGVVMPTGSLFLARGIIFAPAKVEPAYEDKIKLRLFNTTQRPVVLKKGEKIASVIFFATESTSRQERPVRGSEISVPSPTRWQRTGRWLSQNRTVWMGWIVTFLSSSMLATTLMYFLYYRPLQAKVEANSAIQSQSSSTITPPTPSK